MEIIKKIKRRLNYQWRVIQSTYAKYFMKAPQVLSVDETLNLIIQEHYSVSRNGDGELDLMMGEEIEFQHKDPRLASIMREAISTNMDKYLSCLLDIFENYDQFTPKAHTYFNNYLKEKRYFYYKYSTAKRYGNSAISRFYMGLADKSQSIHQVNRLKEIWAGQDVILVEGKDSRLGVNNDLFSGAHSLRRILGPAENAFDFYDELISKVKEVSTPNNLILLALAPTATAMAYELAKAGYWAVDIGHIDIEYEWYRMGATTKVPIPGKYTNESTTIKLFGTLPQHALDKYEKEIISKIF